LVGSVVASGGVGVAQAARTSMPTLIIPQRMHDPLGRDESRLPKSNCLPTVIVNHTGVSGRWVGVGTRGIRGRTGGTEITPVSLVPDGVC
jgi:hypothetical protein